MRPTLALNRTSKAAACSGEKSSSRICTKGKRERLLAATGHMHGFARRRSVPVRLPVCVDACVLLCVFDCRCVCVCVRARVC